ncbi:hypothetical protein A2U01_0109470, partial [Trifolium medium]|nr:hypothetical protein [Trifolium medium]
MASSSGNPTCPGHRCCDEAFGDGP